MWRADASNRQDENEAAWRRLQPTRRSSPRGRPRTRIIAAWAGYFHSHRLRGLAIPIRSSMPSCSVRSRPSLTVAA
jgi:hypothetical protein